MRYFLLIATLFFLSPAALAQQAAPSNSPWASPFPGMDTKTPMTSDGEILTQPVCFRVINRAPYTVTGSLYTNFYTNRERQRARHTSNFRLEKEQSIPFCTYGPFYEGRKLELVLRSLLPIFSCKTMVDADIYIMGKKLEEGGTKTWATCLDKPSLPR